MTPDRVILIRTSATPPPCRLGVVVSRYFGDAITELWHVHGIGGLSSNLASDDLVLRVLAIPQPKNGVLTCDS